MSVSVFPVDRAAKPTFRDDWGEPRGGGTRTHKGTDIFAPRGSAVFATADGSALSRSENVGGNALYLTEPDGTSHYYAHLDEYAGEFPRSVRAGELVAYVGNTGNAADGPTHLHFQLRPGGGDSVNPYPSLKRAFDGGAVLASNNVTHTADHLTIYARSTQTWLLCVASADGITKEDLIEEAEDFCAHVLEDAKTEGHSFIFMASSSDIDEIGQKFHSLTLAEPMPEALAADFLKSGAALVFVKVSLVTDNAVDVNLPWPSWSPWSNSRQWFVIGEDTPLGYTAEYDPLDATISDVGGVIVKTGEQLKDAAKGGASWLPWVFGALAVVVGGVVVYKVSTKGK